MSSVMPLEGPRHVRAAVHGTAQIAIDDKPVRGGYVIENLSLGGVLLTGAWAPPVHTLVEVDLQIAGGELLQLGGRVVRLYEAQPGAFSFAVEFREVEPGVLDELQGAVLEALARARAASGTVALVVDAGYADRDALMASLAPLVTWVLVARTLKEALDRLQDVDLPVSVALVSIGALPMSGLDFLTYVKKYVCSVRRVLVALDQDAEAAQAALESGIAEVILPQPWSVDQLAGALGLERPARAAALEASGGPEEPQPERRPTAPPVGAVERRGPARRGRALGHRRTFGSR